MRGPSVDCFLLFDRLGYHWVVFVNRLLCVSVRVASGNDGVEGASVRRGNR